MSITTWTGYNYSEISNSFLSNGFTSNAGNTYLNSFRLLEGIIIKEDIGQGYRYTFLNGIRIYSLKDNTLLCERNFHNVIYNKRKIKSVVEEMLIKEMQTSAAQSGINISSIELRTRISELISKGFQQDQRLMLENQTRKYLTA